jgi:50S ribosomal subunit-associated GTPase HflX
MDAVEDMSIVTVLENRLPRTVRASARTGDGLDALVEEVLSEVNRGSVQATLRIGVGDGRLLAAVNEAGQVHQRRYDGQYVELDLTIDQRLFDRILTKYPQVEVVLRSP